MSVGNSQHRQVYIFFREGVFYPVSCDDDAEAKRHSEINPGTLKVEDVNGRLVWKPN